MTGDAVNDAAARKQAEAAREDLLVGKRRRMLRYLERTDLERYRSLVAELGLRSAGSGASRRAAEQQAAQAMIEMLDPQEST